jgi:hypothetical protein
MASARTPTGGTISMIDLDKSITSPWTTPTSNQDLSSYNVADFNPGGPPSGFAFCYGHPGVGTPIKLSDYYDLIGWVDYTAEAISINNVDFIFVNFNTTNGSNGTPPATVVLDSVNSTLPNGVLKEPGAHWETLMFQVEVGGMTGSSFDVYLDGHYVDTINSSGIYSYDNGGLGFTNGYGSGANSDQVYVTFQ